MSSRAESSRPSPILLGNSSATFVTTARRQGRFVGPTAIPHAESPPIRLLRSTSEGALVALSLIVGLLASLGGVESPPVVPLPVGPAQEYRDPSGRFVFPSEVGGWVRGNIFKYQVDPGGVSVEYQLPGANAATPRAVATAYVYPRGRDEDPGVHVRSIIAALMSERRTYEHVSTRKKLLFSATEKAMEAWIGTLLDRTGLPGFAGPAVSVVLVSPQGQSWLKWRVTQSADRKIAQEADRLIATLAPSG